MFGTDSPLSQRSASAGLVIAGLIGLVDLMSVFREGPPIKIAVGIAALGLLTMVCAVLGWRGSRIAILAVIGTRLLGVLLSLPVFLGVAPTSAKIVALLMIVVAFAAVGLLVSSGFSRQEHRGASIH